MPGLLRGMARTAAVAGTATAVRGRVARRQQQRWAAEDQAQYAPQAAARPTYVVAQPPPQPAPAPAPAAPDPVSQLERLAALKQQGILTDEEFSAQKAKILGT